MINPDRGVWMAKKELDGASLSYGNQICSTFHVKPVGLEARKDGTLGLKSGEKAFNNYY
jgi:hypothetical protein